MLSGIDPLLTGELLAALDAMGHSDAVCIADGHFPAARLGRRLLDLPGVATPNLLRAVCTVLPLDDAPAVDLMSAPDGSLLPIHEELLAVSCTDVAAAQFLDRHDFYEAASRAFVVIRTGEVRTYANVIARKGVVAGAATASVH